MPRLELHPAFVWDCEECGSENFERAIIPPFQTEEEEQVAREICEIEEGEGFPVLAPRFVTCRICHREFETDVSLIYGDDDDEHTR